MSSRGNIRARKRVNAHCRETYLAEKLEKQVWRAIARGQRLTESLRQSRRRMIDHECTAIDLGYPDLCATL